jgi:hypothetical protein
MFASGESFAAMFGQIKLAAHCNVTAIAMSHGVATPTC